MPRGGKTSAFDINLWIPRFLWGLTGPSWGLCLKVGTVKASILSMPYLLCRLKALSIRFFIFFSVFSLWNQTEKLTNLRKAKKSLASSFENLFRVSPLMPSNKKMFHKHQRWQQCGTFKIYKSGADIHSSFYTKVNKNVALYFGSSPIVRIVKHVLKDRPWRPYNVFVIFLLVVDITVTIFCKVVPLVTISALEQINLNDVSTYCIKVIFWSRS